MLDVGCEIGVLAINLREEVQVFNQVYGLDYPAPKLAVAQREGRIDVV